MVALKFSRVSSEWNRMLKCEEFYEMHLKRVNEEKPTSFSMVLKTNDPAIQRYKIDPFPEDNPIFTFLEVSIQCVIGSCDGIVGMGCKIGEDDYLMLWNPLTRRVRYLYYHYQKRATSVGMGRKGRVYHFMGIDSTAQLNIVYDSQKNSWVEEAISELKFSVSEPTCDVIIDGLPYWRASWPAFDSESVNANSDGESVRDNFGGKSVDNNFIVYANWEGNNFGRIDYPEIKFPLGNFRSNKLIQIDDKLGIIDFYISVGAELRFDIWTFADENGGNWKLNHAFSKLLFLHSFWVTTTKEMVYQNEEGSASYSDRDNNKEYGPYTPVVLNHINTLAFF
ncbi:hypothetical protein LguiB_033959 [Lonicera macranthoides]